MADLEQKKNYIEGINTYYKLKSKYDANLTDRLVLPFLLD